MRACSSSSRARVRAAAILACWLISCAEDGAGTSLERRMIFGVGSAWLCGCGAGSGSGNGRHWSWVGLAGARCARGVRSQKTQVQAGDESSRQSRRQGNHERDKECVHGVFYGASGCCFEDKKRLRERHGQSAGGGFTEVMKRGYSVGRERLFAAERVCSRSGIPSAARSRY